MLFWLSLTLASLSFGIFFLLVHTWPWNLLRNATQVLPEWIPSFNYFVAYRDTGFYAAIPGFLFGLIICQKLGEKRSIALSLSVFSLLLSIFGFSYHTQNLFMITVLIPASYFAFYLAIPSFASHIVKLVKKTGLSLGMFEAIFPLFMNPWSVSIPMLFLVLLSEGDIQVIGSGYGFLVVAILLSTISLVISRKFTHEYPGTKTTRSAEKGVPNTLTNIRILLIVIFTLIVAENLVMSLPVRLDTLEMLDLDEYVYYLEISLYFPAALAGGILADRLRKDSLLLLAIVAELFAFIMSFAIYTPIVFLVGFKMPIFYSMLTSISTRGKKATLLATAAIVSGIAFVSRYVLVNLAPEIIQTESPYFLPLLVIVVAMTVPLMLKVRKTAIWEKASSAA